MAADNVGRAFLGDVFGELLNVVTDAIPNAYIFKSELEDLKSTLEFITPTVQEIENSNGFLDIPGRETTQLRKEMMKGAKLVLQSSKMKRFNFFNRVNYTEKIVKLKKSIETFCHVNLQTQMARDNRRILVEIDGPCSVPDSLASTPGFDVPMKELRTELLKDDGMQVIVVSAPGGAGKTTLIEKLCKDGQVKDKFQENIFFVTVSKTPDVMAVVQRIHQHMKKEVLAFPTEEAAINDLERLLKSIGQGILLVLDDVWSESVVQKFKFELPNYKILVTSRSVFPQFGSGYQLKPLNNEAAMILFRSSVTPQDGEPYFFDENLAEKILRVCKGSPLTLTAVGRLLCGELAAVWQNTVKEWDRGKFIFISGTKLLECLQSTLDALDEEVKECYLDLGSFPENQRIPITALIDMWMELYECVEDGLSAITKLHKLSNRNLVSLFIARKNASDDGYYNDHFVMQKDLLRELIIHQSMSEPIERTKRLIIDISGNKFPEWWSEKKTNPIHARLLSISTDETFSSCWYELNALEVEVLVLNLRTTEYTLPNFMENMGKLKVLIVTNHEFLPAELSNFSILCSQSISNLKRIRLEHVSIPSFDVQMNNLQKISLVMCSVGQANFQISVAFPNLLEFEIDHCYDLEELPDGLCDMVSLKKLSITNCHKLSTLPEGIGKLVYLEELRLASCTELSELPEEITELSNLKLLDISECLGVSELPTQVGKLSSLETLCMIGCSSCELPQSLKELQKLNLVKCNEETAYEWEPYKIFFEKLEVEVLKEDINLKRIPQHKKKGVLAFQTEEAAINDSEQLLKSKGQDILTRAAIPSPSSRIPQVPAKPESLPMKCQWQKGKLIGRGTFGSVYVARNRETGSLCAMKEVEMFPDDPKSAECIKQLEQEIKVLSNLKHPNIVQYYGSEIVEDKFYIYLEYVPSGSINKYVREHCGALTESIIRNFTRHILFGLAYLHSKRTVHRDIKGANLLVDVSGVVKLADFGVAKYLTGQAAELSLKGSPYWIAPELMNTVMQRDNNSDLALAVDIWSLGCTIIEMCTGKPPWSEFEWPAAMFKVLNNTPSIPESLSAEAKDFLGCCFQRNPADRPLASKLLEHRFLKNSQQQPDVPSSYHQSFSGMKLTDKPHRPSEQSES